MPPRRIIQLRKSADYDSDCFNTPEDHAERLGWVDGDPCSNPYSAIRSEWSYCLEDGQNGLVLPWTGLVFVNPPFSRTLPWIRRAIGHGRAIMLMILDPTTRGFGLLYQAGARLYCLKKRPRFTYRGNKVGTSNRPCYYSAIGDDLPAALQSICYPAFQKPVPIVPSLTTCEDEARAMLIRAGVKGARKMSSGDLVEIANLIATRSRS